MIVSGARILCDPADGAIRRNQYITGQHRQMLDQALQVFDVRTDIELDPLRHNQTLKRADTPDPSVHGHAARRKSARLSFS